MNVFAGERIVESFLLGAVGYVNPYGNYIPRASYRIWDYLVEGRIEDAKKVQRQINAIDHIVAAGHPTYGHQCYSKALAAAAGYPVGDVRAPLTTVHIVPGEERSAPAWRAVRIHGSLGRPHRRAGRGCIHLIPLASPARVG